MRTFLNTSRFNQRKIVASVEEEEGKFLVGINPLSLGNGIVYLNSISLVGLAHATPIGVPASTEWLNLFGQAPSRNAIQNLAGNRPLLQVTSNQSPFGLPTVRFDGVNDGLFNVNPDPLPNKVNGYSWHCFGRLRSSAACNMIYTDEATSLLQVGTQGNPLGQPPFIRSQLPAASTHTASILPYWGGFSCVWRPPGGALSSSDTFTYDLVGGVAAFTLLALHPTWDLTEALRTGYIIGGACPPNMDLCAWAWFADNHNASTCLGIHQFWAAQFGME